MQLIKPQGAILMSGTFSHSEFKKEVTSVQIEKIHISKLNPAKYNPRKDLKPGDIEYK